MSYRPWALGLNKIVKNKLAFLLMTLCLVTPLSWASTPYSDVPLGNKTIKLGATAYADELATTALAKQLLERIGYNVKVEDAGVGIWFGGLARGDLDVGFNAWLPDTHAAYWKRYKSKLEDLGTLYKPTKNGWVVPDYVPKSKLDSISDLKNPEVKKKLHGIITGIGAGAGLMRLSENTMKAYGLSDYGYTLQASSGPAMASALARAIKRHQWIVVTGWTPHFMWARWHVRYLKDPKGTLGKSGHVEVIARLGFDKSFPRAVAFIHHFKIPVKGVEEIMNHASKLSDQGHSNDAYDLAAKAFIKSHKDLVARWLQTGS